MVSSIQAFQPNCAYISCIPMRHIAVNLILNLVIQIIFALILQYCIQHPTSYLLLKGSNYILRRGRVVNTSASHSRGQEFKSGPGDGLSDQNSIDQNRPDDGDSTHLWNVSLLQWDYTALYPKLTAVRTWNLIWFYHLMQVFVSSLVGWRSLAANGFWTLRDNIYQCVSLELLPW
jgi:hypothetical protein